VIAHLNSDYPEFNITERIAAVDKREAVAPRTAVSTALY